MLGQQRAPGLPGREAEALLGCRAWLSPAWRLSTVPATQLGADMSQVPEENIGPFIVDFLGSSHTLGSAESHTSRAEKVCV